MGIKDLTVFLKEYAPETISKGNLSEFTKNSNHKMRAAIDTSLFLYKYKYRSGDNFIIEFLEQINRLLINKIEPIYVFDGIPPSEKQDTIKLRKDRKETYKNKIKELQETLNQINENNQIDTGEVDNEGNKIVKTKEDILNEISKINKKTISVTGDDISRLKYFLDIMNIKYIKRDMEADVICSKLSSMGLVDFVISEDMDHLTSGTKVLLRDFNNKNNYVTIYRLETALNKLNISHERWINLCIMFGCDYVSRIKGLGYKTSYKFINKCDTDSFEGVLNYIKQLGKFTIPDNYLEKVKKAQIIFRNNIDINLTESFFTEDKDIFDNQIKVVKDYLHKYTKFSDQKIKNRIKNIFGYCI
jgi:flap endonuclease-1